MTNIPLRSERHALEEIKRRVAQGQRRGADASEVRALLIEIDLIADAMLEQLAEGIHKNPVLRRRVNPGFSPGGTHVVRAREIGRKAWSFVGSGGRMFRGRVRALILSADSARALAADINESNPGEWEAEAVPL